MRNRNMISLVIFELTVAKLDFVAEFLFGEDRRDLKLFVSRCPLLTIPLDTSSSCTSIFFRDQISNSFLVFTPWFEHIEYNRQKSSRKVVEP